jgi:hypothetical protein
MDLLASFYARHRERCIRDSDCLSSASICSFALLCGENDGLREQDWMMEFSRHNGRIVSDAINELEKLACAV